MKNLTHAERSAIRKEALAAGIRTSSWTDDQLREYGYAAGLCAAPASILANDPEPAPAASEPTPEPIATPTAKEIETAIQGDSAPSEATSIDAAIKALIAASARPADLDESRVVELIQEHAASAAQEPISVTYTPREGKPNTTDVAHYIMPEVLKWLDLDEHVWLWGPASSGKTHMARQCAEAMDLQFYSIGAILQKYEMLGYEDANGVFRTTEFVEWFTKGGLLYWDEADASVPQAMIAANGALENKFIAIPSMGTVTMHESCKLIVTANTIGTGPNQQYTGRLKLDAATLDRFVRIEMDYDKSLERKVGLATYAQYGGTDSAKAAELIAWAQSVREVTASKGLSILVSSRMQRRALKRFAVDGMDAAQSIIDLTFAEHTADQKNDVLTQCGQPLAA